MSGSGTGTAVTGTSSAGGLVTAPACEPVSLQEIKNHLRLDAGAFETNLTTIQAIPSGSHAVSAVYTLRETMTLDVAPGGAGWAAGDTITGNSSAKTCQIVEKISGTVYVVWNRSGAYTLGEILTNGVATADQGALFPTFLGTYTDVLGLSAVVTLDSGINLATGTVDAKIQECDTATGTYTDWTGGAFTQVTTANDNAIQEIAYTGSKQYIRVVAKVLVAACSFGVQINKYSSDATEDDLLTALVTSARQYVEAVTRRQLITAVWDKFYNCWPTHNYIQLPHGQLQSVTSVKYTDSAGVVTTMAATTDYIADTASEPGRIVLPYGIGWPSTTYYSVNPIAIRYTCGYGSTAASVPAGIRSAIKMLVEDMYEHRSATHNRAGVQIAENKTVMSLLFPYRLFGEL
jgi:uncharacterized phiE125 gp8 family phage protein